MTSWLGRDDQGRVVDITETDIVSQAENPTTVDIRDEGAIVGAADNSNAINNSIFEAAKTGGTVVIPGKFTAVGIVPRSGVRLDGLGYGVLRLKDGSDTALIGSPFDQRIVRASFVDFEIDGNKANQAEGTWGLGIGLGSGTAGLGGCEMCLVEGLYIHDTIRTAVYLEGPRNTVFRNDIENVGNTPDPGRTGIVVSGENVPGGWNRVGWNRCRNCSEYSIKVYPRSDHSTVGYNLSEGSGRYGIYVQSSNYVQLPGNDVDRSGDAAILIQAEPGTSSSHCGVTGGSATNSGISGVALWAAGGTIDGTRIEGVDIGGNAGSGVSNNAAIDTLISGCPIHDNGTVFSQGSAGVDLYFGSLNAKVDDNIIWNNGNSTFGLGVWSLATNTDIGVTHNRIFNRDGRQAYGVASGGLSDFWTVTDNNLRGNLVEPLSLAGVNNVVHDNMGVVKAPIP